MLSISDIVKVSSEEQNLEKQECIIADATATSKIVLWNNNVHKFEVHSSYELHGLQVRTYQQQKYLSLARDEFSMKIIDDIGNVQPQTTQVLTNCVEQHAARFDVKSDSGIITVTFFSPLLDELCNSKVSSETLLLHQPFAMNITNNVAKSLV